LNAAFWLVEQEGYSAKNLLLEIDRPASMTSSDERIVETVDNFLRQQDHLPVVSVAGTIFPAGLYSSHGAHGVYEIYPNDVYPKVKEGWGTYAYRLVRRTGANGATMNPLQTLIEKMNKLMKNTSTLSRVYELNSIDLFADLPLYEGTLDSNRGLGHPCLSHLSLRVEHKSTLALTAIYRSHFYVQKTLGNLLGLAQLQSFIANETKLTVGMLTIHSIHAELERQNGKWGKKGIVDLIAACKKAAEMKAA
jgi:hypothetical protein